jgi:hypothetical protein
VGFNVITDLDRVNPQRGPYEASERVYPGRGQVKTGGEQEGLTETSVFHYILPVQRLAAVFFLLARHKMNML